MVVEVYRVSLEGQENEGTAVGRFEGISPLKTNRIRTMSTPGGGSR